MKLYSVMRARCRAWMAIRTFLLAAVLFLLLITVARIISEDGGHRRHQEDEKLQLSDSIRRRRELPEIPKHKEWEQATTTVTTASAKISMQEEVDHKFRAEVNYGQMHLSDMDHIRRANSDIVPRKSYFNSGTISNLSSSQRGGKSTGWELCTERNGTGCVRKFARGMRNLYLATTKYKSLGCILRKNMSTLLQAIFCYLRNEEKIRANGTALSFLGYLFFERPGNDLCEARRENQYAHSVLHSLGLSPSQLDGRILQAGWRLLAVVREPVDRFLSGFVDKCIRRTERPRLGENPIFCNGCGANLTCFIITEYQRLKKYESIVEQLNNNDTQLRNLAGIGNTMEDIHFFPQNWRCNFKQLLPHYTLIRYHSSPTSDAAANAGEKQKAAKTQSNRSSSSSSNVVSNEKLIDFLSKSGVGTESLAYIRRHLEKDTTHHVTHDTEARRFLEQRLRGSPFLMEFLVRMFYWDFRLLGFDVPVLKW